jgi:hypothetical protein
VFWEIRHFTNGGRIYSPPGKGLVEAGLHVCSMLAIAIGLERLRVRTGSIIHNIGALVVTGIAFFFIAFAVLRFFPGGRIWWFWMLIPAFACIGEGIGQYLRLKSEQKLPPQSPSMMPEQPVQQPQIKAPTTSSLQAPAGSITEGTTRTLDPARRAD